MLSFLLLLSKKVKSPADYVYDRGRGSNLDVISSKGSRVRRSRGLSDWPATYTVTSFASRAHQIRLIIMGEEALPVLGGSWPPRNGGISSPIVRPLIWCSCDAKPVGLFMGLFAICCRHVLYMSSEGALTCRSAASRPCLEREFVFTHI